MNELDNDKQLRFSSNEALFINFNGKCGILHIFGEIFTILVDIPTTLLQTGLLSDTA